MSTVTIPNVDLTILSLQHSDLMDMIWDKPESLLWGLVEMLDYVLDNYDYGIDNAIQDMLEFDTQQ